MNLVIIESPYAGDTVDALDANVSYARRALADSLARGEAPFASHLLYTQPGVLDDGDPAERRLGIDAGFVWGAAADLVAVYVDRGISPGMEEGIRRAREAGQMVVYRTLGDDL